MSSKYLTLCCLAALSLPMQARAEEGDLVEKVAVRNRLFTVDSRFELGADVGLTVLGRLTDHYVFSLSGAYNVSDWLGLELRAGYAYSQHTSLARQVETDFYTSVYNTMTPTSSNINDLSDMWEMMIHAIVGARFQPIYGKINLVAELPVHFQAYLWAGGGFGFFKRTSVVVCPDHAGTSCGAYLDETKPGPLVSIAGGFRFFINAGGGRHSVKIEVRDYSYLDSYLVNVKRDQLSTANPTGGGQSSPNAGVTNLVALDLGYSFIF